MTESQKLEEKLKQIKAHCEESRAFIKNEVKSYENLLEVLQNRSEYLVNEITVLSLDKEFVTLLMRFEDDQTLFIRVVPKELQIN